MPCTPPLHSCAPAGRPSGPQRRCPLAGFDPLSFTKNDYAGWKLKEIKNGRLAMLAFLGFVAQHNAQPGSPLDQLADHLSNPWKNHFVNNGAPGLLLRSGAHSALFACPILCFCTVIPWGCTAFGWARRGWELLRQRVAAQRLSLLTDVVFSPLFYRVLQASRSPSSPTPPTTCLAARTELAPARKLVCTILGWASPLLGAWLARGAMGPLHHHPMRGCWPSADCDGSRVAAPARWEKITCLHFPLSICCA